ncbi:hypothetical protein ASG12_01185 [Williamsia sp. Leaf354]|nr:hypothetical protein ASG12_01185 [Williamsia sp. Leaf354]
MVVIAMTTVGCGAPDRSAEAAQLETTLGSIPGVESADVYYTNGFDSGYTVDIKVMMPGADDRQVVAMVRRMNAEMGNEFDDYGTPVTIGIGDNVVIESGGRFTPEGAAADLATARVAQTGVAAGWITVSHREGGPSIDITDAADPVHAATVMSAAFGSARGEIDVMPREPGSQLRWLVNTPVSDRHIHDAAARIDTLGTPVAAVTVDDGGIAELWIDAGTETNAHATVSAVIHSLGAGRNRPLRLHWRVSPAVDTWERDASGSASVGTCDETRTDRAADPRTDFEAASVALERRIRAEYETCRK